MEGLIFGGSYMYIGRTLYMEGPIYRWPYMWRALYAKGFICKGPTQRALYMDQGHIYGGHYMEFQMNLTGLCYVSVTHWFMIYRRQQSTRTLDTNNMAELLESKMK